MNKKFIIILIITGLSLYFLSLFGQFLWDDEEQIVNNQIVHSIGNIITFFTGSTFNTGGRNDLQGIYYKPILSTSYSVIYSLFGAKPFYFHLFQVLIHISNAIIIFYVFKYLLENKLGLKQNNSEYSSFLISLIFLVHPINTESVAYISALQDTLYFFWGMLGLSIVVFKVSIKLDVNKLSYYVLISVCLLFSILSKESGILFLLVVPVYCMIFENKLFSKRIIASVLSVLSLYIFIRFVVAKVYLTGSKGISPIMRIGLKDRIICIPEIILFYIRTYFYPKDFMISQHWIVSDLKDFYIPLAVCMALITLTVLFACKMYKFDKRLFKLYVFFIIWLFLGLGLHMQVFPLDMTVADRWFYFPQVGLLGALSILIYHISKRKWADENFRKIILISILTIVSILGVRTLSRSLDWSSGFTLYKNDIKKNPDAFDLTNNLGVEYFRRGEIDKAEVFFRKSTEIAPYWWTNWNNLGVAYEVKDDFVSAEEYYRKAIDNSDYFLAYENLAKILYKQEKYDEAGEFLEEEALTRFPYNETLNIIYIELENKKD